MAQRRDSKGRFASGSGARAGQIRGAVAKKNRQDAGNILRNVSSVAAGSSRGFAGGGVRVSPSGQTSVAGRPVGGGTARAVATKVAGASRAKARRQFEATSPAGRKQATRGYRRYLGPMK
jgi:hypothetical protein